MSRENKNIKSIKLDVRNATVDGDIIGVVDKSTHYNALTSSELFNVQAMEQFSINAATYIASAAMHIITQASKDIPDHGLDSEKIKDKFKNMKCSESYIREFNQRVPFFSSINSMSMDYLTSTNFTPT